MNREQTLDRTLIPPAAPCGSLCQSLVLRTLASMKNGYMSLSLPDGTVHVFGRPGAAPAAAIRVRHRRFFQRCALFGDIGLGESFTDGDWETDDLTAVIAWFIANLGSLSAPAEGRARRAVVNLLGRWNRLLHLLRPNSVTNSRRNISAHYDLGNAFYALWLDRSMTYSSAWFTAPDQSLEAAQDAKYDALCRQLDLRPSDRLLEIGCGWGGFSAYAARHYGCHITAVTISPAQYEFARARFAREGVADRVDLRLQDYRHVTGVFDKIASIEMMEAIGDRYLETFFTQIHRLLAPRGLAGFQFITVPDARHAQLRRDVDWIQKHIFPGSLLLSVGRVGEAIRRTGDLALHRLDAFGSSYARTLRLWRDNFNAALAEVRRLGFDDTFIRKWNYYLCYCEAAFATGHIDVVQGIYARPGVLQPVRA